MRTTGSPRGDYAEVEIELTTSPTAIEINARVAGSFALHYREMTAGLPASEWRS